MLFDTLHERVCLHYCALYGQQHCIAALFESDVDVQTSAGPRPLREAYIRDSQGLHRRIPLHPAPQVPCCHPVLHSLPVDTL